MVRGAGALTRPPPADRGRCTRYPAKTAVLSHTQLLGIVDGLAWGRPDLFAPHLAYLKDASDAGFATDDWALALPQTSGPTSVAASVLGTQPVTLVQRGRNARSDSIASPASPTVSQPSGSRAPARSAMTPPFASQLHRPRRGAVLLYPVVDPALGNPAALVTGGSIDPARVVLAAAFIASASTTEESVPYVRFRAVDSSRLREATIEVP